MPYVMETFPAGCSTRQIIHYLQECKSARFCQYDFGLLLNQKVYGSWDQPDYDLKNIHPCGPTYFYYSQNDYLAAVEDVERLACNLYNYNVNVTLLFVVYLDFNHSDYLFAIDVKDVINFCVVQLINKYENRPYLEFCMHLLNRKQENICV